MDTDFETLSQGCRLVKKESNRGGRDDLIYAKGKNIPFVFGRHLDSLALDLIKNVRMGLGTD